MDSPHLHRGSVDFGSNTPRSARHSVDHGDMFRHKSSGFGRYSSSLQGEKGQEEAYFTDLLSYSLERLGKEPDILNAEKEQLKRQSQDAAVQHYKGFIEVSKCLITLRDKVGAVSQHLSVLQEGLPQMDQVCEQFIKGAQEHAGKRSQNKQLLRLQGVLAEILEVPTLMDTCLRSGSYDDVLDLRAFISKLTLLHPDLPVVKSLVDDSEKISQEMLQALLARLRSNIQLPECLRVVAHLRRLAVFSEASLHQTFLECREEWLSGLMSSLDDSNAYDYLKRLTDVHRLQLFDVVMQFRAIFSDSSTEGPEDESTYDGGAIFTWSEYRVMLYIEAIAKYLPKIREGGGLASVLEHCMYCGMSLGRVGLDFRGLLPPIFEACILGLFTSLVQNAVQACLTMLDSHSWLPAQSGARRSRSFAQPPQRASSAKEGGPPYTLMEHPPLAVLVNGLLNALNELRHCALLSIQSRLAGVLQDGLQGILVALSQAKASESLTEDAKSGLGEAIQALTSVAAPYIAKCFTKLYSDKGPSLDIQALQSVNKQI